MDKWDACGAPVDEMQLMKESLLGRKCYAGLDLSSTSDITALVLVFPPDDMDEGVFDILPIFWVPEETVDLRVRRDHVPYDLWVQQGLVSVTEGNVIHYRYIEERIQYLGTVFNIVEIAYDRWGATQLSQDLEDMGFTVVPFGQGFRDMSPPTKELMKLTLEKRLAHGGHPVLRWMMDNVYIRKDPAGNIKMDKEKSTEKIDGAVAMVMGLDRAIKQGGQQGSVYDDRPLLVF
jgi:phage terminase large subunit-like protein